MKFFVKKKQTSSLLWMSVALSAGFCLMLLLSLFAYRLESRYVRALENQAVLQQGRIDELEHVVQLLKK